LKKSLSQYQSVHHKCHTEWTVIEHGSFRGKGFDGTPLHTTHAYIYIYIYIYIYTHIHTNTHICIYHHHHLLLSLMGHRASTIRRHLVRHTHTHTYIYIYTYTHTRTYIHTHTYIHVYIFTYIFVCVYMYIYKTLHGLSLRIWAEDILEKGYAVAQLVEALRYKPKGRGFDCRWSHWNFSVT
jgi:phosphatidylserine synthase